MTGNLRHINKVVNNQRYSKIEKKDNKLAEENLLPLVHESCNYSNFSLFAAVGALLIFAGIILYALIV